MMNSAAALLLGLLLLAAVSLFLVWRRLGRRRISGNAAQRLRSQWKHALSLNDPKLRVLEAEKVLDHAFRELGVQGSFGEKLKKGGARFVNLQQVWEAHKLRNRIAHEPGIRVNEREAGVAVRAFEKALLSLL